MKRKNENIGRNCGSADRAEMLTHFIGVGYDIDPMRRRRTETSNDVTGRTPHAPACTPHAPAGHGVQGQGGLVQAVAGACGPENIERPLAVRPLRERPFHSILIAPPGAIARRRHESPAGI